MNKHLCKCLFLLGHCLISPTSSFLIPLLDKHYFCCSPFLPSIIPYFSTISCLCHLSPPHISVCLFYLYPIIPPSCWLADLNPELFWSSALGETNSLWLYAATHILFCPSALTVCMKKRQGDGGGRGLKKEKASNEEKEDKYAKRSIVS